VHKYVQFQRTAVTVVNEIVETVAADAGRDPTDLPPLYDAIDPDVVTHFVESARHDATLEFRYCENRVTVSGTGSVETAPLAESTPASD
jgi:hypothetical protein